MKIATKTEVSMPRSVNGAFQRREKQTVGSQSLDTQWLVMVEIDASIHLEWHEH